MWSKRDDMVVHDKEPFNAEPPPGALAGRPLTPVEAFYSRNHGSFPDLAPATWQLRVDGLVDRGLVLSLADLHQRFSPRTEVATLVCAGNRRAELMAVRDIPGQVPWGPATISTAEWTGVSLADVLAAAGPAPGAAHVAFLAPDISPAVDQPYGSSIPLTKACSGEVLLAWEMNGEPLPPVHGGPVRVVVPGYIGARSVKWVQQVTVQAEPSDNYFQAEDYRLLPPDAEPAPGRGISLGPLVLTSAILSPDDGSRVAAGPTEVAGYALAGEGRSIARVDVSLDGGRTWVQAAVEDPPSPWAWQLWRTTVVLPAGPAEITARAWDDTGATQPDSPASVWNPSGYDNTSRPCIRLDVR
ncbi:sulfite oxidase [Pseudonocardia sp.]|jgi:sulfite oxidase|uniref:sulfite oxidase n=1 Tax=Pseudonocardia sp. TaxID=60912 RepID=UPI002639D948|nr:sulfite oxidase [Pseudonocardia sp.]MCW2718515.1 sulfite oxidase [Pseudonocardia sp.]MDT7616492.1 sulfite oxidase [Pseudonocardiales bacterium]